MTFLSLSPLRKDSTVPLFSQWWINAFAAPAQQSLFISEGMRLKGLLSPGDGSACIGPQGANVRKKARPGECRGGTRSGRLNAFLRHFLSLCLLLVLKRKASFSHQRAQMKPCFSGLKEPFVFFSPSFLLTFISSPADNSPFPSLVQHF